MYFLYFCKMIRSTSKTYNLTVLRTRPVASKKFFPDFTKAFDQVPKERLLGNLEVPGITGSILARIRDRLTDIGDSAAASTDWKVISGRRSCVRSPLGTVFFDVFIHVPLYSFLYSGKCSFYSQATFTNNSYIPNP